MRLLKEKRGPIRWTLYCPPWDTPSVLEISGGFRIYATSMVVVRFCSYYEHNIILGLFLIIVIHGQIAHRCATNILPPVSICFVLGLLGLRDVHLSDTTL